MSRLCFALFCLCLASLAEPAVAQLPAEDWRTLEVPGYRIHTPVESERWARHVAGRLQDISEKVQDEIGYRPEETADVLVIDPIGRANGSAWSILGRPRMLLYTTPPASDSVLGFYEDWVEILTLHEAVHLTHLLRPSRNPRKSMLERLIPMGPVASKSPKWVIEGYATLLEGRLTGWGRPNGDMRAALLRKWAQAGRLPSYGELSGNARRWYGGAFPYLVGSAFLEWLEERAGEESLRNLWRRLSAVQDRSFANAFSGVFGDEPSKLYHRFVAEVTFRAMSLEEQRMEVLSEGELWHDLQWRTGAPTVSTDGQKVAAVLRSRGRPSRLMVWSTEPDSEFAEKRREEIEHRLARDPEDVAAVQSGPLPPKKLFELPSHHGAEPYDPRFLADGSLIFTRFDPASDAAETAFPGAQISDLYRWWPDSNRVERVTRDAGVRRPDPASDGTWAVAVRHPYGLSQLVRVDLETGEVTPLIHKEPSIEEVVSHPRLSSDDGSVAYVAQRQGRWSVWVHRLASGTERRLPTPEQATLGRLDWTTDGKIVVSIGDGGFLDLMEFDPETGARRRLTRSTGAALAPAASPTGELFFLGLEEDGLDLRRLWRTGANTAAVKAESRLGDLHGLAPVVRPKPPESPDAIRESAEPTEARSYGLGPRELFPLIGGGWSRDGGRIELGLRQGDPVGRLELWLLGASADDGAGAQGLGLAARWKGWPVEMGVRGFSTQERSADGALAIDHEGIEITLRRAKNDRRLQWLVETGLFWDRSSWRASSAEGQGGGFEDLERKGVGLRAVVSRRHRWGAWRLRESLTASVEAADTDGSSRRRYVYGAGVEPRWKPANGRGFGIRLDYLRGEVDDFRHPIDAFEIGGTKGSLLPFSVRPRYAAPALPSRALVGSRFESQKTRLDVGLPWSFFGERHRAWNEEQARGEWLRLVGLEWTFTSDPMPLLRLPGFEASLGVAQILDPPFEDQTEGWIGIRWRP